MERDQADPELVERARDKRDRWQHVAVFGALLVDAVTMVAVPGLPIFASATGFTAGLLSIGSNRHVEDPPRPDFTQPTRYTPVIEFDDVFGTNPFERAAADLVRIGLDSVALTEALVTAEERAQGARLAWANQIAKERRLEANDFAGHLGELEKSLGDAAHGASEQLLAAVGEYDAPVRQALGRSIETGGTLSIEDVLDIETASMIERSGIPREAFRTEIPVAGLANRLGLSTEGGKSPLAGFAAALSDAGDASHAYGEQLLEVYGIAAGGPTA